jgi:hypothetical protein
MTNIYSDRSLGGVSQSISLRSASGDGGAGIEGNSATLIKVLTDTGALGDIKANEATVTNLVGATLAMLGHAVQDNLTSTSTTDMLSAKQGKVLKDAQDSINTLLSSDNNALDTLQEIVDFVEANKGLIDSLAIANVSGLQAALDLKSTIAAPTFTGGITVGGGIDVSSGTIDLKGMEMTYNDSTELLTMPEDTTFSKDVNIGADLDVTGDITLASGKTVDGVEVSVLGADRDKIAARTVTITKDSTSANWGNQLKNGVYFSHIDFNVTESFTDAAGLLKIGNSGDNDKYATMDFNNLQVGIYRVIVAKHIGSNSQLTYTLSGTHSAGCVKVTTSQNIVE